MAFIMKVALVFITSSGLLLIKVKEELDLKLVVCGLTY